jgi:TolB-like protein
MSEKRKLSAVLFADIAGYTAMMQEDESKALRLINKFKKVIESETGKYNGRIVQFFGDGCLLTFESSTEAVDCAMVFQTTFGETPEVPVRIGIHMGEVLFKSNNAFGNGVNVASRIESMGIPGSILVSKTVRDKIINKTDFLLASLGSFEFKNVQEPMEVFALANQGFVIPDKAEIQGKFKSPKRKKNRTKMVFALSILIVAILAVAWILMNKRKAGTLTEEQRQQPVAIMEFENLTKDKTIDDFGLVVKDWISHGLLESGNVPVIILNDSESGNNKDEKEKFAAIPTGVGIVVNGRYYNQSDDQVATVAEIVDVKTKKILFTLKPVLAIKDSLITTLDKLRKLVISYWGIDGNTDKRTPPPYTAYLSYVNGKKLESSDFEKAKNFYYKSLKIDSTFNLPLFALAAIGINNSQ